MQDIERRVLEFVALASPVNSNRPRCSCNVKPVSSASLDAAVRLLDTIPMRGKTYERPAPGRIVMGAAPWVRRMMELEGQG